MRCEKDAGHESPHVGHASSVRITWWDTRFPAPEPPPAPPTPETALIEDEVEAYAQSHRVGYGMESTLAEAYFALAASLSEARQLAASWEANYRALHETVMVKDSQLEAASSRIAQLEASQPHAPPAPPPP